MPVENSLKLNEEPIVITGVGLTTALGLNADQTWANVVAGKCGMGPMSAMESPLPPGSDGAQAVDLPSDFEPDLPREVRYLRWTLIDALRDANALDVAPAEPDRCAIMLGTTLHGIRAGGRCLRTGDYSVLRDFVGGETLRQATEGLGFQGSNATTCSACSSSLGSVVLGVTMLQTGQADFVVAGGYDTISEYVWAGFNALRLVSPGVLRPFTRGRQGMKLGEGYGILILERASDAARRQARPRAIVAGWGESADAHHLTQPHPQGQGAAAAMRSAVQRAGIQSAQLDLVVAHATGTPDNDAGEYAALSQLLGDRLSDVPVACFKSHLGHTLGGAGAVELVLSTMAMRDGVVPGAVNVEANELEFAGLNVPTKSIPYRPIRHSLNTSLGFGGANTCVVLSSPDARNATRVTVHEPRQVWLTGIGVVLPGAIGNEAFIKRMRDPGAPAWERGPAQLADADFEHLLNARRVRRMSSYVKLMLASATLAIRDAQMEGRTDLLAGSAAFLGTTHGSSGFSHDYYGQIVREGVTAANPVLFAEGVPNVGSAQLSLMLGLKEACQTIIGSRAAGLDALRFAWLRIASGACDRVIVGAGEESHPAVDKAYDCCGFRNAAGRSVAPFGEVKGFCSTAGAVSFILESESSARARGRMPYARVDQVAAMSGSPELMARTLGRVMKSIPSTPYVISSANGTWLDRAELAALMRSSVTGRIGNAYDTFGEVFSATPLLGIAAALLTGRIPALSCPPAVVQARCAAIGESVDRFTSLCTDFSGSVAAATVQPLAGASV